MTCFDRLLLLALLALASLSGCYASRRLSDDGGVTTDRGTRCLAHAPAVHRTTGASCDHVRPPGTSPDPGGGPPAECFTDADCAMDASGRCNGNGHDGWRCTYDACFADLDCTDLDVFGVCECQGGFRTDANACLPGNCRTDADCATGFCSPTLGSCGDYTSTVGWYCHTCEDTCVDDTDCSRADAGAFGRPYCAFDALSGRWGCQSTHCAG